MGAVQPVTDELLSGYPFTLGDLGFVVRKNIVDSSTMDVELIAQERCRHRAALDVPTGPAWSPWRIPLHIAILVIPRFPKRKIADVFLVIFIMFHPAGSLQLGEIKMGELSVIWKFVDAEINRFVLCLISETPRDEYADHLDHPIDVTLVCGRGKFISSLDSQCLGVFEECPFELLGKFCEWHIGFARPADRLVIDVGDIHHSMDLVAA